MWEKIDLNHRARQKFLWFLFPSPADSCCSGKPARAAQEQLFMKQNEQALIPAATAHTALLILSGNFPLSQCQSKNKSTHLWSPSEGQWALRSIFGREMRVEQSMVVIAESAGGWQGSHHRWLMAGQLSPESVHDTSPGLTTSQGASRLEGTSADQLIPAPCSKCASEQISCRCGTTVRTACTLRSQGTPPPVVCYKQWVSKWLFRCLWVSRRWEEVWYNAREWTEI